MVTARAHLGRPRRIDRHYLHASPSSFVLDELPQLVERPTVMESPLGAPQALVGALTDTLQLFQGNRVMRRLRRLYDVLADLMVHPFLVATFFATKKLSQNSLRNVIPLPKDK